MKLLHISDLHIGRFPNFGRRPPLIGLARAIIDRWDGIEDKPLVVITGDLTDNGYTSEYMDAAAFLHLLTISGFDYFCVPGNHDYGPVGNLVRDVSVDNWREYIHVENPYPIVHHENMVCPDYIVIGLDSMQAEKGGAKYWADGQLGKKQINAAVRIAKYARRINGPDHKIIMALHHHPFNLPGCDRKVQWWHALKDGDIFMDRIKGLIDAVLCGHEHKSLAFKLDDIFYNMADKAIRRRGFQGTLITYSGGEFHVNHEILKGG